MGGSPRHFPHQRIAKQGFLLANMDTILTYCPFCDSRRLHTEIFLKPAPWANSDVINPRVIETYCADCGIFLKSVEMKTELPTRHDH